MILKDGFVLREIADTWVVVPVADRVVEFNGLITLSESGALLWKKLAEGCDSSILLQSILQEYDIDEASAKSDIEEFIAALTEKGLLV